MTAATAWAHLPNAKHIDTILADVKARPKVWDAAWDVAWTAARDAARAAAWVATRDAAWTAAWHAAQHAAWTAAWGAVWPAARDAAQAVAWHAILALIAWDDSARMLDMPPETLRTLIDITEGDVKHQAVLLLPAVIALQGGRA